MDGDTLLVASCFPSIDGEVNWFGQGVPTWFIRLAGCNLRCWGSAGGCDTPQALRAESGAPTSVETLVDMVKNSGLGKVTITGGEPLLQKDALGSLLMLLEKAGIGISVETNGSIMPCFEGAWAVRSWVVDHKCPSTGEHEKMAPLERMYEALSERDYIKFVVGDDGDYDYAVKKIRGLPARAAAPRLAFSPKEGAMPASELAAKMLRDRLATVQLNVQIHKYIWPGSAAER